MLRLPILLALALVAQQPPAATGLIVGRVLDRTDQRPISGAAVSLSRGGAGGPPLRQLTDSQGRFVFRELPAGTYMLRAEAGGTGFSPTGFIRSGFGFRIGTYVDGGYGQVRPGGRVQPLPMADGQIVPDAVIQLWRGAVISGTVLDDLGEPVVDTVVGAVQLSSDGRLLTGPTARTDDRGAYRLSALVPGRYIVFVPQTSTAMSAAAADEAMRRVAELKQAQTPGAAVPPVPQLTGVRVGGSIVNSASSGFIDGNIMPRRDGGALFVFQTTLHPSAVRLASAAPVEVRAGEERPGVDVLLQPVRAVAVRGSMTLAGRPRAGIDLHLSPSGASPDDALFETAVAKTDALGRFEFPAVPVGAYTLHGRDAAGNWVADDVVVGPEGAMGLAVSLKPGLVVRGTLEFAGSSPVPGAPGALMVDARPVRPLSRNPEPRPDNVMMAPPGTFAAPEVAPGRYVLRVSGLETGSPWHVASILAGGRDVNELPIDLTEDISGVRVIFTDRASGVSGRVSAGAPGDGAATVLLFPADSTLWPDARGIPARFQSVRTSGPGDFVIREIPPGDYLMISVPDIAAADFPDVAFLSRVMPDATPLHVGLGDAPAIALTTKSIR